MNEVISPEKMKAEAEALEKDVKEFNAELIPLLGKYKLGLGATPFIMNDGRIGARPQVFRDMPPVAEPKSDESVKEKIQTA